MLEVHDLLFDFDFTEVTVKEVALSFRRDYGLLSLIESVKITWTFSWAECGLHYDIAK